MHRGNKQDNNTTLSVSATMDNHPRVQSTMTGSMGGYGAVTSEDINDRLLESPKTRSYVPLLSKKLKKTGHGSTENVIQAAHAHHHMTEQRQPSQSYQNRTRIKSRGNELTMAVADLSHMQDFIGHSTGEPIGMLAGS